MQQAISDAASNLAKGRIRQSVSLWTFGSTPLPELCAKLKELGIVGLDLVNNRDDWPVLREHGLAATMVPGAGSIGDGLNNAARRGELLAEFRANIAAAAEFGWKRVITFAGGREGISDADGMAVCAATLKEAAKIAEDCDVEICVELLNSKVDHPGYMADSTAWGVELCKRVESPRVKLLYDIYHMQIMEGDVIRTIRDNIDFIGHFHTAGNPGRNDLDDEQELCYPAIMRVIAQLQAAGKFDGYVAHEFIPKNGFESLRQAVALCDARA